MKFKNRIEDPLSNEIKHILNQKTFHIVITGDIGKGKSTLSKKLLEGLTINSGFITERVVGIPKIQSGIYIHNAKSREKEYTKQNRLAILDDCSKKEMCIIRERFPEVFDTVGVSYLDDNGLFLMDEIGFLEKDSHRFLNRINEIFESDNSFIAVIKNKEINYLNALKNKKGNLLLTVDDDFTYNYTYNL